METSNSENTQIAFKQTINLTPIYVLAILGILLSFCCFPVGLVLSIIAVVMITNRIKSYNLNPAGFFGGENLNTAKILAYISLGISILLLIYTIYALNTGGFEKVIEAFHQGMDVVERFD